MEQEKKVEDCGCENGDCCQPKPKPKWMKLISIMILILALSIVMIKVFTNHPDDKKLGQSSAAGTKSCCDTTVKDSTQKPCCPKN